MANGAFLWKNLFAGLTPTATSTTPVVGLAYDKLNDPQPRHRVRLATTTPIIVYDAATAQAFDSIAMISTNLTSSSSVRVRASTADPTVVASLLYDSGVVANVTHEAWNGNFVLCFASVTARYWRIDIVSTNPVDIGLIKGGLLMRPSRNFKYGAQEGRIDLSIRDVNPDTGAVFSVAGPTLRTKLITFEGMTKLEIRNNTLGGGVAFDDFDRAVGASGDLLFVEDPDDTQLNRARDSVYGSYRQIGADLSARPEFDYWVRTFQLRERL